MVISPKFRGFICTTTHPKGCEYNVNQQIAYVKKMGKINGPKKVLVIGASTGFGLASRISAAYGLGAATIGVFFERPASGNRTATAGWYNTAAFEKAASKEGLYAKSINGDAFSSEIKDQTIELIKKDLGKVDLVIYSLASPRRVHPVTGETFNSVLKPLGDSFTNKNIDFHTSQISEITIDTASEEEIRHTIAVMGGEDWEMWIKAMSEAGILAEGAKTVAYSYIGPQLTHSVYRNGTIGKAKDHLEATVGNLDKILKNVGGKSYVSVNKGLVTQASSAIPVVPLYISLLYKAMKKKGTHEGCIEQIYRLFAERLYSSTTPLDEKGRIRIDDLEMQEDIQSEVLTLWSKVSSENVNDISDIEGFRKDFFHLFGFGFDEVDYAEDVACEVPIPSIQE